MSERRIYAPLPRFSPEQVSAALAEGDLDVLRLVCLSAGYYCDEYSWRNAQELCVRLSEHRDLWVRVNAFRGLAYVARFSGHLDKRVAKPVLLRALRDPDEEVRSWAEDAIREVNALMGWRIAHKGDRAAPRPRQGREPPNSADEMN